MNPSPQPSQKRHGVQARRLNLYETMQKPTQISQTLPTQSQSQTQAAFHNSFKNNEKQLNGIVFVVSIFQKQWTQLKQRNQSKPIVCCFRCLRCFWKQRKQRTAYVSLCSLCSLFFKTTKTTKRIFLVVFVIFIVFFVFIAFKNNENNETHGFRCFRCFSESHVCSSVVRLHTYVCFNGAS